MQDSFEASREAVSLQQLRGMTSQNLAILATTIATMLWVYICGKDLNWDYLNYHNYAAALLVEGRWKQDYFAASIQSYLNPLAFVPLYLMVKWQWNSLIIAAILASLHSLNLVFAWRIAALVVPPSPYQRNVMQWLALALAFVAPLHLTMVGSSFSDPIASLFVMGSLWVLLRTPQVSLPETALMGFLLGIATGLKLTNGALALSFTLVFIASIMSRRSLAMVFRHVVVLGLLALLGIGLTHGYWSFRLFSEFSNPVFPLFNEIFKSPDYVPVNYQDRRLLETGILGLLMLPFDMVRHASWVYSETNAPDVRIAALTLLVFAGSLGLLFRRLIVRDPAAEQGNRPLSILTWFFVIGFATWGSSTRFARYAYPLWILAGPLLVGWLSVVFRKRSDWAILIGFVVLLAQLIVQFEGGNNRFSSFMWGKTWLSFNLPERLISKPVNMLTMGVQSFAVVAPFLHKDSGVVNLIGQYAQSAGDLQTKRLRSFLNDKDRPLVILLKAPNLNHSVTLSREYREKADAELNAYGLRLAEEKCDPVSLNEIPTNGTIFQKGSMLINNQVTVIGEDFLVCGLSRVSLEVQNSALFNLVKFDSIFNLLEKSCPQQFSPSGVQTQLNLSGAWLRSYPNTVNRIVIEGDSIFVVVPEVMNAIQVGKLSEISSRIRVDSSICPTIPKRIWGRNDIEVDSRT